MATETQTDNRTRSINVRDDYHELTPKMQAVVDAVAANPDAKTTELARIASDKLDDDSVSRSYVPEVIKKQGHLIDERRDQLLNQRFEGTERTTGDPFESLRDNEPGVQHIQDRPVQGGGDSSDGNENALTVELSRRDVEALLSGDVPEELKRDLLARVVTQAFD